MDDRNVMRYMRNDNDISWVCRFCGHPFPWEVLPQKFRHHLTTICESSPEDVKQATQTISVEGNNSNFNSQTEDSRNAGRAECSRSVNWEPVRVMDASESNDGNFEAETESSTVQRSNKRQRITQDALPIVAALEVPMVGIQDTRESASLTKRLVGDAFGRNEEKIWSWLMDDQVLRVGICGTGGVGKTTLMRRIQTRLEGERSFEVYWITVCQNFSIWKLQNLIAKQIGLSFSDEEGQVKRANILAQAMQAMRKCVLILDDLWNYFDVNEVGISVGVNSCKLVLTTRLLTVCQQMDCNEGNTVHVQPLSKGEAWTLFTQELGNYRTEVEELAKAVSRECAGFPLGIKVMARSMKGISNVRTWRNILEDLKRSKLSTGHEMWEEVFSVLKFSYLGLNDQALQECLSYCALFPEDAKIDRNELIESMIVEGIIDERRSRLAEFDEGHKMLDTLGNACLLEGNTRYVWMRDIIRDMVILEWREESKMHVEAGAQLTELPDVEKWTENLVRVSLMCNEIEVIPSGYTPKCPNLSTLLLCDSGRLKMIADSFFEQFEKLKILDLSWSPEIEELPMSIGNLVDLTALLLRDCRSLIHVPSLEKLAKLKKLDLSGCERLKQMPEGVRFLLKLKYLDLSRTGIKEIGNVIIHMLSRLQVLKVCNNISIRGSEVRGLSMLETLHCRFSDVGEFGEYMKSREMSQHSLTDYSLFVGGHHMESIETKLGSRKFVRITGDNFIDPLTLPTDIEALHINNCVSTLYKRLCLLTSLLNLREIHIDTWDDIEEIFAMNEGDNGEGRGFQFSNYATSSLPNHSLLNLNQIDIRYCHQLKKLFPPTLLPNLHNLQMIYVDSCNGIEEIFSTDQEEEEETGQEVVFYQPNLTGLNLPRLTIFELHDLPELRSIYKGAIICHSLQRVQLVDCPKLKRVPLPLSQPSLQSIKVSPEAGWDSLQRGNANDRNRLETPHILKKDFWKRLRYRLRVCARFRSITGKGWEYDPPGQI